MWTLITGASGFVGSNLALSLFNQGKPVAVLQRHNSPIHGLPDHETETFKRIIGDLSGDIPIDFEIENIIHLAAQVVTKSANDEDYYRGNTLTANSIVNIISRNSVKRLAYLSSVSVYGNINSNVITEGTEICAPTAYGESKYRAENIFKDIANDVQLLILRVPSIIGRNATDNWITSVVDKAIRGEPINVSNPDSLFNSSVHVDDIIDLFSRFIERDVQLPWNIFNLAASQAMTVNEMIDLILNLARSKSRVTYVNADTKPAQINTNRLETAFSYTPSSLADAISKYMIDRLCNPPL